MTLHEDDGNNTTVGSISSTIILIQQAGLMFMDSRQSFWNREFPLYFVWNLTLLLQQHNSHLSCDILYVDTTLSGCSSEANIIQYYCDTRKLLLEALKAWVTNSPQLRAITQQEMTANTHIPSNVLSLLWNSISDELSLAPKKPLAKKNNPITTKRELMQESSRLFNPIGLTKLATIQAKILTQKVHVGTTHQVAELLGTELRTQRMGRDSSRSCSTPPDLNKVDSTLATLIQQTYTYRVHAFSDASIKEYGALVYLCSHSDTTFDIAKSWVAPLKNTTLPQLKLMVAAIAAWLVKFVINSLEMTNRPIHIWLDSQITLYWIYSFKKFFANSIPEINHLFLVNTVPQVTTLLTRGLTFKQF